MSYSDEMVFKETLVATTVQGPRGSLVYMRSAGKSKNSCHTFQFRTDMCPSIEAKVLKIEDGFSLDVFGDYEAEYFIRLMGKLAEVLGGNGESK